MKQTKITKCLIICLIPKIFKKKTRRRKKEKMILRVKSQIVKIIFAKEVNTFRL